MQDLLDRYLSDLKQRIKMGEFGRATAAISLRKTTKLDDIEIIINDLIRKSNNLLSQAEKEALYMAE